MYPRRLILQQWITLHCADDDDLRSTKEMAESLLVERNWRDIKVVEWFQAVETYSTEGEYRPEEVQPKPGA